MVVARARLLLTNEILLFYVNQARKMCAIRVHKFVITLFVTFLLLRLNDAGKSETYSTHRHQYKFCFTNINFVSCWCLKKSVLAHVRLHDTHDACSLLFAI